MREDVLQTAIANAEKVLDGLSEALAEPIREMMARYEDHIDGLEETHDERVSEPEEEINGFDEDARTDADSISGAYGAIDAIEEFVDGINPRDVIAILSALTSKRLRLYQQDQSSPMLFSDPDDPTMAAVNMPVRRTFVAKSEAA